MLQQVSGAQEVLSESTPLKFIKSIESRDALVGGVYPGKFTYIPRSLDAS